MTFVFESFNITKWTRINLQQFYQDIDPLGMVECDSIPSRTFALFNFSPFRSFYSFIHSIHCHSIQFIEYNLIILVRSLIPIIHFAHPLVEFEGDRLWPVTWIVSIHFFFFLFIFSLTSSV